MFELTSLQLLHALQLHLGYIVAVHVHKYVLNHDYAHLLVLPYLIDLLQEIVITTIEKLLTDGLEQFNRRIFNPVIQEVSVFVKHETIGGAV